MTEEIGFFVGIDWASQKHRMCLLDAAGGKIAERDIIHGGAGLAEACDWLLAKTGARPGEIAVAIETPRGPVVEIFLERGFQVYSINPKQLDRFRDRFSNAGAKDDSRDAHVLADSVRTDRQAFRRLSLEEPVLIELREWSRMLDDLQEERNRLTNRMREQLWRYYPQAIELAEDDLGAEWFLDVWRQVPTPAKAARVREQTIADILKARRIRRVDAAGVLRILRQKPLWVAPGTTDAACAHIRTLVERLRLINQQIKEAHDELDKLCAQLEAPDESTPGQVCEQRDVEILRSLPGIGRINLATLLAEGWDLLRRRDYHGLRTLCGAAPVTRSSGKKRVVVRRYACNKRLQNAVYHWSRTAMQNDPHCRQRYQQMRRHGHSHARALRGLADRLLFVMCTLLERQTLFDPGYKSSPATAAA
jgi:transposase